MKKTLLIGPANSGKSAIFNMLSGANRKVANYNGITVDTATADNSKYFKGGVSFVESDDSTSAGVISNGNSNSKITLHNAVMVDLHFVGFNTTYYYIWGVVASDTVPVFADQ